MAGSFEGRAMPESIDENVLGFRREIKALQEKRKFDATVNDIVIDRLGKAELDIWWKYKDQIFDLVSNDKNIFDEEKLKIYQDAMQKFSDKIYNDNIEPAFKAWMANRIFVILSGLQGALFRGPGETDGDVQHERIDIFSKLTKEKEEIFG